ncbi:MAG: hypothetical protein AB1894_24245 [Chloroflexota bacterium]
MLAPVTHILPLTTIRRERALPVSGKVLVRKGQKVGATDTIAEAQLYPEHLLLDIGRGLGMSSQRADRYLACQPGEQVTEGDVIAGPVGFSKRVVRSPRAGTVLLAGGGQVLIEATGEPFELKAGIPGDVVELISDRGAIVETTGALIQGMWGNGRIEFGVLTAVAKTPEDVLTPEQLDVSLRGAIVLAAHCEDPEVFKSAEELPLRGLILASLVPALAARAAKAQFPVILLEGFGRRPLNPGTFQLLSTNDRREVALNAEVWDMYEATRPELVIPLPSAGVLAQPAEAEFFALDQQVRVLRPPYVGETGTIVELKGKSILPSGIHAAVAVVRLEAGSNVELPVANLEVLV